MLFRAVKGWNLMNPPQGVPKVVATGQVMDLDAQAVAWLRDRMCNIEPVEPSPDAGLPAQAPDPEPIGPDPTPEPETDPEVAAAPAEIEDPEPLQCEGTTKSGNRCRRNAIEGARYCAIHWAK